MAAYDFDIAAALEAIKRFNSNLTLLAADRLLNQHFPSKESSLDPKTIAERVVLLDGVWATQLFREAGSTERIIRSLANNVDMILQIVSGLSDDELEHDPQKVMVAAQRLFPYILHLRTHDGEKTRQNYSFATKFFHWLTRRHFPIVDSRARGRINRIQRASGEAHPVLAPPITRPPLEEYPRWIQFYSGLIKQLPMATREQLLAADLASQPEALRVEHSLLRLLDKVFYIWGGGTGLGQMSDA